MLHTDRLALRELGPGDADRLVELDGDPEVMRFLTGGRPTAAAQVLERTLPRARAANDRPGAFGWWAAHERATDDFLGWFNLLPVDGAPGSAELGYRLRRAAWGRGLATEGARLVVAHAFTDPAIARVTAQTMTVNTGSRRVLEKAGLTYLRTFFGDWPEQIGGSDQGDVEYAVTREEWRRQERTRAIVGS